MNSRGELLEQVRVFSRLQSEYNDIMEGETIAELTKRGTEKRLAKSRVESLLVYILYASGLLANELKPSVKVSQEALEPFINLCRTNRTIIEEVIGEELRQDLGERAVLQFRRFLAIAGLSLVPCGRNTED